MLNTITEIREKFKLTASPDRINFAQMGAAREMKKWVGEGLISDTEITERSMNLKEAEAQLTMYYYLLYNAPGDIARGEYKLAAEKLVEGYRIEAV